MKSNTIIVVLILLVAGAFYLLGKKNGQSDVESTMVQNVQMVKQIAELSALDVTGNVNIKISNKGADNGTWAKFKNYFAENTLQVNVPYDAKYGVDMANQKLNINTNDKTVTIQLPACKMLSMQLKLNNMETMSQTGLFTSASMTDLVNAQKQLYNDALLQLEKDPKFLKLAEQHIAKIFTNYYKPLGYNVKCVFESSKEIKQ
jgi:predicted RND superfamily exporter protein